MKVVSSFMDDLTIRPGECHTITFQSTSMQSNFRQLFRDYFSNRKADECNYVKILNKDRNKIAGRNFYFVHFDCSKIQLKNDRETEKQLREILYYYLEHNPYLLQDYIKFTNQLEQFISQIHFTKGQLSIDFEPSDKTITQLIRSLDINIEYDDSEQVPNYMMRDFLINALLDLNMLNKEVVLLIEYPETDIGMKDYLKAMELVEKLEVTTIVITSHKDILTTVNLENMLLVHENGSKYDIMMLKEELLELEAIKDIDKVNKVAKFLAYKDFKEEYFLLEENMKRFLLSDRV